jgi:hypothetical protein
VKRFAFLFVTICAGLVAARASAADALWDRTAEKVRRGQDFLPAEAKITSEVLRDNGGVFRTFSVTVKRSVQDGQVVREIVGDRPSGKRGKGDPFEGQSSQWSASQNPVRLFPEGQSPSGPNSPSRSLLEGTALSPFAESAKMKTVNSGETRTIAGENVVRYAVEWTDEAGYAFSGSVWISPDRERPIRAEYVMKKHPWGAEVKELRASMSFGNFEGLPVRDRQIVEAKITARFLISVDLRSTTDYADYFDPSKEKD